MFLLQNKSNGSYKAWQFDGEETIFSVFFWVVVSCGVLGEYERLEHVDSIFSAHVIIVGIRQIT